MKTGDMVTYSSDVHPDYSGQNAVVMEFDLVAGMVNLKFEDGMLLWVFWDEIAELNRSVEAKA